MLTVKLRMQKWNKLAAVENEHLAKKPADASHQPSVNGLAKNDLADSKADLPADSPTVPPTDSPAANRIDLLQTKRVDRADARKRAVCCSSAENGSRSSEASTAGNQKQSNDRSQGQHDETANETAKVGIRPPELNDLDRARLDNRTNLQTANAAVEQRNAVDPRATLEQRNARRSAGDQPSGWWKEREQTAISLRRGAVLERRSQTSAREAAKQNHSHNSLALPNPDKFVSIKTDSCGRPFESVRHSHDFTAPPGDSATSASINQRINQFGRFERANQQVDLKRGGHLAGAPRSHQSDRPSKQIERQINDQQSDQPSDEILSSAQFAGDSSSSKFGTNSFATNPLGSNSFESNPFAVNSFATNPFRTNAFIKHRNVSNFQRSVSDLSGAILRKSSVLENRSINPPNEPRHPLKLNLKNLEQKLDTSFGHTSGKFTW